MEWRDEGIVLGARRHGETAAIVELFTARHGRHAGVVPGGAGRRMAPVLQPGAQLALTWRARLEEQIGTLKVEPMRSRAGALMQDADALAALVSVTALLLWALPERQAQPMLYARSESLLDSLGEPGWPGLYALWELALLADLGFGLDLGRCAVTGGEDDLAYVSPKTGRAVSRGAAGEWADRLLPLPGFLADASASTAPGEVGNALALTGHFLRLWLAPALEREALPEARGRLVARLGRSPRSA